MNLDQLTEAEADALLRDWSLVGRPSQQIPKGDWSYWLYLGGRGTGKTRTGVEMVREIVKQGVKWIGLIAPTVADTRKVMVEGESGFLAHCSPNDQDHKGNLMGTPIYEPALRSLKWANGAVATLYSAEEPERLRGPQHEFVWCDELAAWPNAQYVWDMMTFGLRLGKRPRVMVTTTPRPIPLLRWLIKESDCIVTRETTFANSANLAPAFLKKLTKRYEGTMLGRQELMGEVIENAEGALWQRAWIKKKEAPELSRILIGVDPAMTANTESALTGIVVVGLGTDGCGYVLEDGSGRFSPEQWARKVAWLFDKWKADRVIAEGNQGGDLVAFTLRTHRSGLPVKIVNATRGKMARAEPVSALYEQGRVFHTDSFADLEDQLCTWEPLGNLGSPDRLDALVWALTELMVEGHAPIEFEKDISAYLGKPLSAVGGDSPWSSGIYPS